MTFAWWNFMKIWEYSKPGQGLMIGLSSIYMNSSSPWLETQILDGIYCPNTCRWGDNDKAVQTCSNNKWLECRLARFDHLRSRKTKLFFFFAFSSAIFFLYKWAPFQCINSICQMLYISFRSPIKNADKCAL